MQGFYTIAKGYVPRRHKNDRPASGYSQNHSENLEGNEGGLCSSGKADLLYFPFS